MQNTGYATKLLLELNLHAYSDVLGLQTSIKYSTNKYQYIWLQYKYQVPVVQVPVAQYLDTKHKVKLLFVTCWKTKVSPSPNYSREFSSWQQVLCYKYYCQYRRFKQYQYFTCKYQYLKSVLKYTQEPVQDCQFETPFLLYRITQWMQISLVMLATILLTWTNAYNFYLLVLSPWMIICVSLIQPPNNFDFF